MIKTMNTFEVRTLAENLITKWEDQKMNIPVSGKALFHIMGVKKTLKSHLRTIGDTLNLLATQHGGEPQANGQFKIPNEQIEDLNKELADFYATEIDIEFTPITLSETDELPVDLMEALYDFIEMAE